MSTDTHYSKEQVREMVLDLRTRANHNLVAPDHPYYLAAAALSQLLEDTERLDWLETQGLEYPISIASVSVGWEISEVQYETTDIREAIDAARTQEPTP